MVSLEKIELATKTLYSNYHLKIDGFPTGYIIEGEINEIDQNLDIYISNINKRLNTIQLIWNKGECY